MTKDKMKKNKQAKIEVQGRDIAVLSDENDDYISLTDMVQGFDGGRALIEQWLKNKDTILFLGVWERLNNPDFKTPEFEGFKTEAGRNSFFMSAKKWIEATNARGLIAKAGRYGGGTFAHKDIAFEFGSWLSPEFKLYLIKEFQRLKEDESRRQSLDWSLNRTLAKLNYRIHTDAVKEHLVPEELSSEQAGYLYASEADLLNVALFGQTAKQWREANQGVSGNIREAASVQQLLVMANIENLNAELIKMGVSQPDRLKRLREAARTQMRTLLSSQASSRLSNATSQPSLADSN